MFQRIFLLLVGIGILVSVISCDRDQDRTKSPETNAPAAHAPEASLDLPTIAQEPKAFKGRDVMITGKIDEILNDKIVTLKDDTTEQELIIVSDNALADESPLAEGEVVEIRGKVQEMSIDQLGQQYALEIENANRAELRNVPVVVANDAEVKD